MPHYIKHIRSLYKPWYISQKETHLGCTVALSPCIPSGRSYLRLHCFGVLYGFPVLPIYAVGHLKLPYKGSGLCHADAVPASGSLDNHASHILRDSQINLQPFLTRLRLRGVREPSWAAADQASYTGGPMIPSSRGGWDLGVRDESRKHPQHVWAGWIWVERKAMGTGMRINTTTGLRCTHQNSTRGVTSHCD